MLPPRLRPPSSPLARACRRALAVALWGAAAAAQPAPSNVQVDRLGTREGLPGSLVAALHQDSTGFLWVGTGAGLARYDGYGFEVFRHEPGDAATLSLSDIHAVTDAPAGDLWVGTYGGGLNRLAPATGRARAWRHRPADAASPSDDRILTFFRDARRRLWMGTAAGVEQVDEATGRVRRLRAGLPDEVFVRVIRAAPGGQLWLGTDAGLFRVDPAGRRPTVRWRPELFGGGAVQAVARAPGGGLWIGTERGGLSRLDAGARVAERLTATGAPDALCGDQVHSLHAEPSGALWAATRDGGVCRMDLRTRRFAAYRADAANPQTLPTDDTRVLFADRTGLLWVGTWSAGLARLRRTPFAHVAATPAQGFRSTDIRGFADGDGGTLWVGTSDAGLYRYDRAARRAEQSPAWPPALRSGPVRALARDADGTLWVTGADGGAVFRLRAGRAAFERVPIDGPPIDGALDLDVGPDGTVWLAAYGRGLCWLPPGAGRLRCADWTGDRALTSTTAYAVHADPDGSVWVAYWGEGVDRVDPARGRLAHYDADPDRPDALAASSVTAFFRDRQGRLWLSTYGGGLDRFDPALGPAGGFHHLSTADGLPDAIVYAVQQARDGSLWVSTNRGLAHLDAEGAVQATFDAADGLQSDEFNGHSYHTLADGSMAFGGTFGFNLFDPARIERRGRPPALALTGLRVLGAPYPLTADVRRRGLRLRHDQTAVAFDVAALDFTAPDRNRYAYRLDGLDAEWTKAGAARTAAFTNLAPGRYTFRLRAAGASGVWTPAGLALPVEIRPAWWQTTLVRVLALLAALAALAGAVWYASQRRLRAQVLRLETDARLRAERERISRDLHDSVGAQLSSVLAGVDLARIARRHPAAATPVDPLDAVEADARETMRQLRETIWALHDDHVSLADFAHRVRTDARARARGGGPAVEVHLEAQPDLALRPQAALSLYRLVREAVTNSLKHAGASRLVVRIETTGDRLEVEVADDGAFRQSTPADAAGDEVGGDGLGASGYGLQSMQQRAEALGGTFALGTTGGTTVHVGVPLAAVRLEPA